MERINILIIKQVAMKTNHHLFLRCTVFIAVFAFLSPVFAQETAVSGRPRIIVFGFSNLTGDSSFSIPSETATDNLIFSLKLLNRYETIETDMFLRNLSDERLARYCASNSLDFILYGTLIHDSEGRQNYELSLFDREKGETTVHEAALGESVMDVFDVSDRLSASVLGSIIGRKLTFGSIQLVNAGLPAEFDVFIDDVPARSGEGMVGHIPDGPHLVRLVRKDSIPWGTPATLDFNVTVEDSATATVSFAFEALPVAEEETVVEDTVLIEDEPEESIPLRTGFMVSAYGVADFTFGDFSDVLDMVVGGGGSLEYTGSRFGCVVRGQWAMGIPAEDGVSEEGVDEYSSIAAFGGVFLRFPQAGGRAEIRMELAAGIWRHEISFCDETDVSGTQMDAAIEASIAFRVHSRPVGFEFAPLVTVLPEKSGVIIMGGIRAGLVLGGWR